jgi:cell division protein FtsB
MGRRARLLVIFAGAVLLANALVGERGLVQLLRTRHEYEALAASVEALKRQNLALAQRARQFREDPAAIEQLARQDLGLARPGEVIVIVKPTAAADRDR